MSVDQLHEKINIEELQARDVMISRGVLTYINKLITSKNKIQLIIEKFTQNKMHFLLCCNKTLKQDKIGICSLENIIRQIINNKEYIDLVDPSLELSFVPENQDLLEVLHIITNSNTPICIVVDKIGEICGVITKESVMNFLINFNISGSESINRFSHIIPNNILQNIRSETIGGFIMEYLDKIPAENDSFILNNFQFTIIKMNKNTIKSIAITAIQTNRGEK